MILSKNGFSLIKKFEGCRLTAYRDAVGVLTIGYGWTQSVDGVPIYDGMTIDQQTAEKLLENGVKPYEAGVQSLLKVPVTQNQFDALVSFSYNLGVGALRVSTLLKKLNRGDVAGAADEFPKWIIAGGQALEGLKRRRAAEQKLFLS